MISREHVISDKLLEEANLAFSKKESWIALNTLSYFLDSGDMYFFKTADEAHQFSTDNISDYDNYRVIHAYSIDDLLRQIPYGHQLEKQLRDPDANGLYNRDGNAFTDALIEHIEQQQILNNKNVSVMNEKNFDYLKDNLKYLGFGEKQHEALEKNLREGKESFQLTFNADVNKKPFEAILNFRRSDTSDMYFLNSYKASLEWGNGEKKEQTFYLNYGKGVTAKEAFNLLSGRSVEKELVRKLNDDEKVQFKAELKLPREQQGLAENWEKAPTYKAWIQLDFENKDKHNNFEVKQFHEKFKYDLKEAVGKYAVAELDGGEKEKSLLQSLQKGNLQSVTIDKEGTPAKMFIEANPQYKTVNLYDEQLKRVQKEDLVKYQNIQHMNGKEVKQSAGQEQKEDLKHTEKMGKKNKDEDGEGSLLPKKRSRKKKGMGLN
ncbi:MAG: hypothetical protein J0I32_11060 [Sphingobacteriales bacterium]|nr:hypothetical protein [Sphingobacteriales bacterium]OJW01181.1 MAG: hypothetical protein BGO52_07040 [Sphingobacteriales bacterium 44-61]